jgi:hypothetical protein
LTCAKLRAGMITVSVAASTRTHPAEKALITKSP